MRTDGGSKLLTVSWVLLLLLGILITLGSLASFGAAYFGQDQVGPMRLDRIENISPELATAIRARRATAASWALAFGLLFIWVVCTAYRRRERWAWWAIVVPLLVGCALNLLRIPLLDYRRGAGTSAVMLAVVALGALLGARDFFKR